MENKKIGRPKKTLNDLPQGWQTICLEMGREGYFDVDVRVRLGISKHIFYEFMEEYPEFTETINEFRDLSHTFWNSIPRKAFKNGESKNINSNLFSLVMRNRFKDEWNEAQTKVDLTSGGEKIDSVKKIEIEIIKSKLEKEKED
jgi:hypothetical protein